MKQEYMIYACSGRAIDVKAGQLVSVIDIEGGQVVDFFAERAGDGEAQDESGTALLEGVGDKHERHGDEAEKGKNVHQAIMCGCGDRTPSYPIPSIGADPALRPPVASH